MAITDIIEEKELTAGAPSIKYEGDMNPDQGSGIMEMASMESGQAGTLEEIYFELIADGMDPESASIKAREIYNDMSSQPQDMMQEPRTMAADGGVIMQGGVKNYLGKQETVSDVPLKWQSGPDAPDTELAYITKAEKDLLLKKDIHGSLQDGPNTGPEGIMSLDSQGDKGDTGFGNSYGDRQTTDTSPEVGDRGGGYQERGDPGYQDTINNIRNAAKAEEARQQARQDAEKQKQEEESKRRANDFKISQEKTKTDRKKRITNILTGKFGIDNPYGLSPTELAELKSLGIDPNKQGALSAKQQQIFDQMMEKNDRFSGVNLENFQNKFNMPTTGITSIDMVGNLLKGPLSKGSKYNKEFFSGKVLDSGKYKYDNNVVTPEQFAMFSPAEMQEVYGDYMGNRMSGETDAYGNPNPNFGSDAQGSGAEQQFIPITKKEEEEEVEEEEPFQLGLAFRADGGRVGKAYGGSMGDDGRRAYGLGSIFKKATKALKKVAKSPIGKAALMYYGGNFLSGLGGTAAAKTGGGFNWRDMVGGMFKNKEGGLSPFKIAGTAATLAPFLFQEEEDDESKLAKDNTGFDVDETRRKGGQGKMPYSNLLYAMGGRVPAQEGGPMGGEVMEGESEELLDMNGMEKDYREDGGFVPLGEYEKKDDVPARLSKNEFVFTADAVRGAGEGDVDLGAEKLYTQMKELESVGKRMQGANEMFQTSQRLEEVV